MCAGDTRFGKVRLQRFCPPLPCPSVGRIAVPSIPSSRLDPVARTAQALQIRFGNEQFPVTSMGYDVVTMGTLPRWSLTCLAYPRIPTQYDGTYRTPRGSGVPITVLYPA